MTSPDSTRSLLSRFLHSRYAPLLTHMSLIVVTGAFYFLLWWLPFWAAFVPCVFLAHRVAVLTHEYWHGAPFGQYRYNHAVVTLWDGVMMTFGLLEVARGMHLIHHRWLNVPAPHTPPAPAGAEAFGQRGFGMAGTVAALRHLFSGGDPGRRKPYVKRNRMAMGFVLSLVMASVWILTGNASMLWRTFLVVAFTIVVPGSLRDTVEHNSEPGDAGFANEYRTIVPMFNVNRHIHHHEDPTVPWYLLEWRTSNPLPPSSAYFTYWVRKYVSHELVRMQPMPKRIVHQRPKR